MILFVLSIEVTWTKDNTEIISTANYTVKVEGERHSLLIKSARISDAGKYCVTAVNQMGRASSSATLIVKAGQFDFWWLCTELCHKHNIVILKCIDISYTPAIVQVLIVCLKKTAVAYFKLELTLTWEHHAEIATILFTVLLLSTVRNMSGRFTWMWSVIIKSSELSL